MDCIDISWLQAWDRWWADQVVADCRLYGLWTIRSLGRAGKVLQFLSAAVIVLELVGYERLAQSAERMKERMKEVGSFRAYTTLALLYGGLMAVLTTAWVLSHAWNAADAWTLMNLGKTLGAISVVCLISGVFFSIFMYLSTFYYKFQAFVFKLRYANLIVGWFSVLLLLVGFTLDLLAS